MHDPKSYLEDLFAHEHVRSHYVHENDPDDSMFRGAVDLIDNEQDQGFKG